MLTSVGAWALGCFHRPNLSNGADSAGAQLRGDKECPFSGVTSSGRVWRKVPESDARSELHHSVASRSRDIQIQLILLSVAAIITIKRTFFFAHISTATLNNEVKLL